MNRGTNEAVAELKFELMAGEVKATITICNGTVPRLV